MAKYTVWNLPECQQPKICSFEQLLLYFHRRPHLLNIVGCSDGEYVVDRPLGTTKKILYPRVIRIQDEYNRLVSVGTLRDWLSVFQPPVWSPNRSPGYFRYRVDPVPGIHRCGRWSSRWRDVRKNRSTYLQGVEDGLTPSRTAKQRDLVYTWGDDFYRSRSRSWKDQRKKRKQWM